MSLSMSLWLSQLNIDATLKYAFILFVVEIAFIDLWIIGYLTWQHFKQPQPKVHRVAGIGELGEMRVGEFALLPTGLWQLRCRTPDCLGLDKVPRLKEVWYRLTGRL